MSHSYNRDATCPECGDMDGCHMVPAKAAADGYPPLAFTVPGPELLEILEHVRLGDCDNSTNGQLLAARQKLERILRIPHDLSIKKIIFGERWVLRIIDNKRAWVLCDDQSNIKVQQ